MTQGNLMIVREERTFSTCTSLDDVTPWCYTRTRVIPDINHGLQDQALLGAGFWIFPVQEDLGSLDGYWGYCSPNCSGELPSPASKFSLTAWPDFWNLALFDLSTWGSGICYTYDPPAEVNIPNMRKYKTF